MRRAGPRRAIAGLALIVLAGCATASLTVPAVGPEVVASGQALGSDEATLARGRAIYVDRCARCHAPYPIAERSEEQWREVLPPMIASSRLDEAGGEAVTAYVLAALRAAGQGAQATP